MSPTSARRSHRVAADAFIARAVAIFVLAMAVQSAGGVIAQTPQVARWWLIVIGSSMVGAGGWVIVSGLRGRNRRPALTIFALAALAGLALWPIAHPAAESGPPWLWNVLGVCVACIAAAWGQRFALVYTGVTAVILAIVRHLPAGGAAGWAASLQDTVFLVAAGLALTAAIQAVRVGAERADASALAAADAHHASAVARARLIERHRLGAILHDSVLSALVAAARARTPAQRQSAAELAADSLHRIEDYGHAAPTATFTRVSQFPDRLRSTVEAAALLPVDIYASLGAGADGGIAGEGGIPGEAAEALLAAVHAAVDNAGRHSGAERITVRMTVDPPLIDTQLTESPRARRLRVEVCDEGDGFDPESVSSRCLGVRLSIIQRMLDAGGSAVVDSVPGQGTRVILETEVPG